MDLFMKSKQFKKMTLIHSTTGMINVVRMLLLERSWFEVYLHKKDIEVASFFILYHTKTIIRKNYYQKKLLLLKTIITKTIYQN